MALENKKFSASSIIALKEALAVLFWKKDDLRDFLRQTLNNTAIIDTLNWGDSVTKRVNVKELIERMTSRYDLYMDDLVNLFAAVSDFNDFSHLDFWDEDGSKKRKAEEAVKKVRENSKGYFQLTKEREEAAKRKIEAEKKIAKNKSLYDELNNLKIVFNEIAMMTNFQNRGFALEKFLNEMFLLYELDPKKSFKNNGEQIDGAFTFENTDYLLEAKWSRQVDRGDLSIFCDKVETKFKNAAGLLITIDGVTKEAISPYFKSIIIMDGIDIMAILDGRVTLIDLLYKKRRKASETGNIYVNYNDL